jgi:hypothetical protein
MSYAHDMSIISISKKIKGSPLINLLKIERRSQIQTNSLDIFDISRAMQLALPKWLFIEDNHINKEGYKTSFYLKNDNIKFNNYNLDYEYIAVVSEQSSFKINHINNFATLVKTIRNIRKTEIETSVKEDICFGLFKYINSLENKLDSTTIAIDYLTAISILNNINKIESGSEDIINLLHDIYHNRYDTIGAHKDYIIVSKALAERKNKYYLKMLEKK